jgi:hypothetical protein
MRNVTSARATINTTEYSKAPPNWPPHKRLGTCIYLGFELFINLVFLKLYMIYTFLTLIKFFLALLRPSPTFSVFRLAPPLVKTACSHVVREHQAIRLRSDGPHIQKF